MSVTRFGVALLQRGKIPQLLHEHFAAYLLGLDHV